MSRYCEGISKKYCVIWPCVSALNVPPVIAVVSANCDAVIVLLPRNSMCSCACAIPVIGSSCAPAK